MNRRRRKSTQAVTQKALACGPITDRAQAATSLLCPSGELRQLAPIKGLCELGQSLFPQILHELTLNDRQLGLHGEFEVLS